jgi:hypothetical protein
VRELAEHRTAQPGGEADIVGGPGAVRKGVRNGHVFLFFSGTG